MCHGATALMVTEGEGKNWFPAPEVVVCNPPVFTSKPSSE